MEPIAIIGMGCRFPKADDPEKFWRLLLDGGDAITEIPSARWNLEEFYDDHPETPGKMNSRWGGFLERIDRFDANFFRISPREARLMDPQQRLLLEVTWEALEDAGQAADRLSETGVGVFIGVMNTEFGHLHLQKHSLVDTLLGAGSSAGIAANRLSYFFNFRGPSLVVDTLCSSSLVAVHLACQSIWNGESTPLAIAGGVNVILRPTMNIFYAKAGLTAPDGRCKAFDARANGIVRGEGAGVVILKPLKLAQTDGDPIYCVIRGSAINHDGRSNGLTSPSRWAQIALLENAYHRAGVSPGLVQYVEAHGTGTPIGDPIEMKALGTVLATDRPTENRCSVGSVKTNIGHLESAAGIASLIKTALVLKHRTRVRNLHFESPNPYIPFDELPLRVQQAVEHWSPDTSSIIAGVSSFGLGGTNAHTVLESFQPSTEIEQNQKDISDEPHLLTLSARSADALRAIASSYQQFVIAEKSSSSISLPDVCYTASVRRSHHDFRLAVLARSMSEVEERLNNFIEERPAPELFKGAKAVVDQPGLAFVFAGQGSQWIGMGLELLEKEPVFRKTIEQCDDLLSQHAQWSLMDELKADPEHSRMHETEIAQPAIFAVQAGLASVWSSWGINPDSVVGHSVGEVAAAYVAGALSLEDAVTVIFQRGRLMQRTHRKGKMLAVKTDRERLEALLAKYDVSVAAVNGPNSFTLSGDPAVIEEVLESLPRHDAVGRMLPGEYAFHSPQMEPLQEELTLALRDATPRAAKIQIFSTLTGQFSDGHDFVPSYWARQIREPVLFAPAMNQLIENGFRFFVEISPDPVLVGAINQCLHHQRLQGVVLSSLKRRAAARVTMLSSLGALYAQGFNVDWNALHPRNRRCVSLPAYPWQKERLWLEDQPSDASSVIVRSGVRRSEGGAGHPVSGRFLKSAVHPETCFWQGEIGAGLFEYLQEHRLQDEVVLPASAYLEMALNAAIEVYKDAHPVLERAQFQKALTLRPNDVYAIQLVISHESDEKARFQVFSSPLASTGQTHETSWTLHAQGFISLKEQETEPEQLQVEEIRERCQQVVEVSKFYESLKRGGLDYGESFKSIIELRRRNGEALACMRIPETVRAEAGGYRIHPALLDACFHPLLATLSEYPSDLYWPMSLDSLRFFACPDEDFYAHAVLHGTNKPGAETVTGDVILFDRNGKPLIEVRGLQGRRLDTARRYQAEENISDWFNQLTWQREEKQDVSSISGSASAAQSGGWLIFSDQVGVGEKLRELLRQQGESSIIVFHGDSYRCLGPGQYQINGSEPEDFRRLLDECSDSNQNPCKQVVHLWSFDGVVAKEATLSTLKEAQTSGCISVLHFIQALDKAGWKSTPRLWLVTRKAQAVEDCAEAVEIAQSTLWGLGKTISQELPQLHCAMVDLGGDSLSQDAEMIFREVTSPDEKSQIAWRKRQRYTAELTRCQNNSVAQGTNQKDSPLRRDSTYLITGGLGALGLRVAQWMVDNGVRYMVLLGRSAPSVPAQEALAKLRRSGAQIQVVKADAANEEQIAEVLARMRREMPSLRGIIHAAGVLNDGALLRADRDSFIKVMEPKIMGHGICTVKH